MVRAFPVKRFNGGKRCRIEGLVVHALDQWEHLRKKGLPFRLPRKAGAARFAIFEAFVAPQMDHLILSADLVGIEPEKQR